MEEITKLKLRNNIAYKLGQKELLEEFKQLFPKNDFPKSEGVI